MSKIVEIKLVNTNSLRIHYVMTTSCTYNCRYCPESLHTGKHMPIDVNELEQFLLQFKHRDVALQLTGGECTTHPQFKEVVEMTKRIDMKVMVDTNGVRTLRFYDEVKDYVDNWCLTLHPSQHELDIEKIKLMAASSFLVVYIVMDPNHWELSKTWVEEVLKLKDLKVTPIRIMDDWGGANFKAEYTQEQLDYVASQESKWLFTDERMTELLKTHQWLKDTISYATYSDGTTNELDTFDLIRKNGNRFKDWTCYAGRESFCINNDGSAMWANCGVKKYKHFSEITEELINDPVICPRFECNCGTDIRSTKITYNR